MKHLDCEETRIFPIKTLKGSVTRLFLGILALVVLLAIAAWALWIHRRTAPAISPLRPTPLTSHLGTEERVALSPDGTYVAFAWDGGTGGNTDIYVQLVGTAEPHPLTNHTADETSPTWSPDGTQIAFVRQDSDSRHSIHVVSVLGGSKTKVAEGVSGGLQGLQGGINGLSWSPTQPVLAMTDQSSPDESDGIFLLSLNSLEKRRLTTAPPAGRTAIRCSLQMAMKWLSIGEGLMSYSSASRISRQGSQRVSTVTVPSGIMIGPPMDQPSSSLGERF